MTIIIGTTNKRLSSNSGLILVSNLLQQSALLPMLSSCIPRQKMGYQRNQQKFKNLFLGFAAGAECLDDMTDYHKDPAFHALTDEYQYHPKSYGDFLRFFSGENLFHMQQILMKSALYMRKAHVPKEQQKQVIFDCDSTLNRQFGKKMEGVSMNYQKYESLSTLNIFDQHGFQYFLDVRPGSMHTSYGIEGPAHHLMTEVQRQYRQ